MQFQIIIKVSVPGGGFVVEAAEEKITMLPQSSG
jgi:hypothetical protein